MIAFIETQSIQHSKIKATNQTFTHDAVYGSNRQR